jgi:MarR family transcriptional regulator, organic hydroperoxide resistance regulator
MTEPRFLDNYLPFLLFRADTLLSRHVLAEIESRGHSTAEWRILATLLDRDGMTIGDLADITMIPQPTVSRWIDRLEASGHLARSDAAHDRRQTLVHLTSLGQRSANDLAQIARQRVASATPAVPAESLDHLKELLRNLIAALDPPSE